jgi:hypothetical protein
MPYLHKKIGITLLIDGLKKEKEVQIRLTPDYYVKELDSLLEIYKRNNDEGALASSLGVAFHTIAAMEGDWGNGEPKLEHAKNWMGSWFEKFKELYPEKYEKLLHSKP